MRHAERAGDILDGYFRRHSISGGEAYVAFYRSWEQIVGQDIASHTNLTEIRNHALCVEVDHPAWMQQVHLRQARILKSVQQRFPSLEIRSLHLRLVEKLGAAPASPLPHVSEKSQSAGQPHGEKRPPQPDPAGDQSDDPAPKPPPPPSSDGDRPDDLTDQAIESIESPVLRASLKRLRHFVTRQTRRPEQGR